MTRMHKAMAVGVSLTTAGMMAHTRAQSPAAAVRQVAYLKASNPQVGAHLGRGGALDGHAGVGVAISSDGNTIAVGARLEAGGRDGAGAVYVFAFDTRGGTF